MVEDEPLFEDDNMNDDEPESFSSDENDESEFETEEISEELINDIFDQMEEDINIMRGFCITSFRAVEAIMDHYESEIMALKKENEDLENELIKSYRSKSSTDE